MKLANFEADGLVRAGVVKGGRVFDVAAGAEKAGLAKLAAVSAVDQLLDDGLIDVLRRSEPKITSPGGRALRTVRLRSPVIYPEKIILAAVNYRAHGAEEKMKLPTYPYLFAKFLNSLIGPGDPIVKPRGSKKVDWEVELAVVIGKEGKNIRVRDAFRHVAGYTIANDVSFRDFQHQDMPPLGKNWIKGKAMDASFPLGPWLVTRDEIHNPHALSLSLDVNGERMQSANTRDLIYGVDDLVAYASIGMTLKPGDIISTGTPGGVAEGTGKPFLKDGDVVEAKIQRIGTLRNPVRDED